MAFTSLSALVKCFKDLKVTRIIAKTMAENDNSKQQIYLGNSFDVLSPLPFINVREEPTLSRPNFKAGLNFYWVDGGGNAQQATGAQLILYPDYPEVRLSGFLKGCNLAPSQELQHIPKEKRLFNNGPDGRILILGISEDGNIFAWLASRGSAVAREFIDKLNANNYKQKGVFWQIPLVATTDSRSALIEAIRNVYQHGWHNGSRLTANGTVIPYDKQNAAGYTLEALLGIRPNSKSAPDYLGYELKAASSSRITLMTPEPNGGFYGDHGVAAFVARYGKRRDDGVIYFTGMHKVNTTCVASGQTLKLEGYNPETGKISNVSGGVQLVDSSGSLSAEWSFSHLISHWGRKHASAAYIPYKKSPDTPVQYCFKTPIYIGEGTTFELYLRAMFNGNVIYDPASKLTPTANNRLTVKARSQFRTSMRHLKDLYTAFDAVEL